MNPVLTTLRAGLLASALALPGCGRSGAPESSAGAASAATTSAAVPTLTRTVVMSGLSNPWDIAFAPDGQTLFVTEKCRGLSVRLADGSVVRLFGTSGSALVAPDLFCYGQSGMNGVALDPDFAGNRTVYVYMASNLRTHPRTNRVVRLVLAADFRSVVPGSRTDIVTDIPFKDVRNAVADAGAHSGGRIRFGPDGYLYITTGDNHNATLPQDLTRLGGKVLRVDRSGTAAPGNHTPSGGDPRIFTYGHRNVQGIAFRPGTGQPFTSEHGPNHSDEVTALVAGGNGGWDPQNRPGLNCPDGYCGYAGNPTTMPMTDLARFPSAMKPSWNNDARSQGTGPCTFLSGTQWKAWDGRLAVGIMGGQRLVILGLDASGMATSAADASLPAARYRSLVQGPGGNLYVVAEKAGEVWRVVPH
ncbi:MAG: PQQ-dependent sugar dehydrogenase [Ideonella sp.]|nr:PQQ-dependent sugar dehydrogenase [Ideonella sp.]MCC7459375.1 PQQ-dependent sugar dehydrogenase [Nitrospira sp.]